MNNKEILQEITKIVISESIEYPECEKYVAFLNDLREGYVTSDDGKEYIIKFQELHADRGQYTWPE